MSIYLAKVPIKISAKKFIANQQVHDQNSQISGTRVAAGSENILIINYKTTGYKMYEYPGYRVYYIDS